MTGRLCGGRRRARSAADKAEREQQILTAADALFRERGLDRLTLAEVAAHTGLTKAALYRYFRSKEVLFLAVYRRALDRLVAAIEALPAQAFPGGFTDTLLAHDSYCRLTAILHVALESGLSEQEAKDFKHHLLHQTRRLQARIESISGQPPEACFRYLMQCQQALIGCWHLSHPSDTVARAMAEPPLSAFRLDFADTLRQHLALLTDALVNGRNG